MLTPTQRGRIDEIRRRERNQPPQQISHRSRDAKRIRAEALGRKLTTTEQGVGGYHAIVAREVEDCAADDDLSSRISHLLITEN